jgi:2-dehydropantoate 2-reductase
MKILIVGAGGIGGYFGAKLIKVGADVTFLLRDKRQKLIQAKGLIVETPKENFMVQPKSQSSVLSQLKYAEPTGLYLRSN